ncbi:endonuclease/exonuclease/phosphatase family protein [Arenibacter sp. 6A1]|uniref:endonuclease/exonuclease/phosphatase family protein n=1 Tax=Arenibacter sp. 6A1 TaxID=2720391 RepID=UPI0014474DF0|nr:endonuclease/exonuclease/phosphatase family protein [Arenibacter sp. 6A1]NKI26464.1 endonuclease/exonuclease/phosphatase family protein [Arenibacter sp. 6A1]
MKSTVISILLILNSIYLQGQIANTYRVRTIAFYNVENLFDTLNDSLTFDDDRTPLGRDQWTLERYRKKLGNIAKVLAEIGAQETNSSPDIIGLCEVENQQVLEDLIRHPTLIDKGYGIIHFDSPDERGIDVGLLYKKSAFIPITFSSHRLLLKKDNGDRDYTRDQLVVAGLLDGEEIHFIVNHWPSRSGGETRSKPNRIAAATLNKRIIDSIIRYHPDAKILSMGDLNDDPIDDSLKKILKTKGKPKNLATHDLFNPMERLFKKGIGTLAYRDRWNLFDQLFFTANMLQNTEGSYKYWKAGVYNPSYLVDQHGRYKGYPLRTYAGGSYVGGYSDHFPVYLLLIKEERHMTPSVQGQ